MATSNPLRPTTYLRVYPTINSTFFLLSISPTFVLFSGKLSRPKPLCWAKICSPGPYTQHPWRCSYAHFALGVDADVQLKSCVPIRAKIEISPKGYITLGVKSEIEKIFLICPKLLINAELYGIGPKAEEMDTIKFGKPICNPCGQCCSSY